MTIIVTHISEHGIIHAADSNLTENGKQARTDEKVGKKLFKIPNLRSALTVAGRYSIGGTSMDEWMKDFISNDTSKLLAEFIDCLTGAINASATDNEKQDGYFIHIAGYAASDNSNHPEFYYITNRQIDLRTGKYLPTGTTLHSKEDFWTTKHNPSKPLSSLFENRAGYIYCNGYPPGRQAYFMLLKQMSKYRTTVWNEPSWSFRAPENVVEEADYLKNDMEHIKLLFLHSNYPNSSSYRRLHTNSLYI